MALKLSVYFSGAASGLDKFVQDLRKRWCISRVLVHRCNIQCRCEEMETKFVDAQSAVVTARERALEGRTEKEILCNSLKKVPDVFRYWGFRSSPTEQDVADMQQRLETALQDRRAQLAPAEKESARQDVQVCGTGSTLGISNDPYTEDKDST